MFAHSLYFAADTLPGPEPWHGWSLRQVFGSLSSVENQPAAVAHSDGPATWEPWEPCAFRLDQLPAELHQWRRQGMDRVVI